MRRCLIGALLAVLVAPVTVHAQTAKQTPSVKAPATQPTADLSGVWMTNVNYTTFWEPYDGAWTKEKFAQYRMNVPRPRMARQGGAKEAPGPRAVTIPM